MHQREYEWTWKKSATESIALLKWCVTASENHKCSWLAEWKNSRSTGGVLQCHLAVTGSSAVNMDGWVLAAGARKCEPVRMYVLSLTAGRSCCLYLYLYCMLVCVFSGLCCCNPTLYLYLAFRILLYRHTAHWTGLFKTSVMCSNVKLKMDMDRKISIHIGRTEGQM